MTIQKQSVLIQPLIGSAMILDNSKPIDARDPHFRGNDYLIRSFLIGLMILLTGCATTSPLGRPECPKERPASPLIQDEKNKHHLAAYWLGQYDNNDQVLVENETLNDFNQHIREKSKLDSFVARVDLLDPKIRLPKERFALHVLKLQEAGQKGKRYAKNLSIDALSQQINDELKTLEEVDEWRISLNDTPIRCYPTNTRIFDAPYDDSFDLAQCARLHYGEAIRVLGKTKHFWFIRTSAVAGWISPKAFSLPLKKSEMRDFLHPTFFLTIKRDQVPLYDRRNDGQMMGLANLGLRLPLCSNDEATSQPTTRCVYIYDREGKKHLYIRDIGGVDIGYSPLTRNTFFKRAFRLMHSPYGWGGMGGKRDCSRMMLDLFASFGLDIPRNSRQQSKAALEEVEVSKLNEQAKRNTIKRYGKKGIMLLYLPGHIMLYVGSEKSKLYAFHQFSGYLVPCPKGGETMKRVNRTTVTSLELGRRSSRRAFIERITKLLIFAPQSAK